MARKLKKMIAHQMHNGVRSNRSCRSPRLINRAYGLPRKPRL
jgi:hypothetical protein